MMGCKQHRGDITAHSFLPRSTFKECMGPSPSTYTLTWGRPALVLRGTCTGSLTAPCGRFYIGLREAGRENKTHSHGTSLVVQWLRLHASNAGGAGSSPGRRTKFPQAAWPKKSVQENQKPKTRHTVVLPNCGPKQLGILPRPLLFSAFL